MASPDKEAVLNALKAVQDPDLDQDIVSLGFVQDLAACDGLVKFTLERNTPDAGAREALQRAAEEAVRALDGIKQVTVKMAAEVPTNLPTGNQVGGEVKNVIAVTSGKGGVGKSTCTVNLAAALAEAGAKVGVLDADVYGPNIPVMMGINRKPEGQGKTLFPIKAHGIKTISVGYLIEDGQPVMWRGPMLHRALEQFLRDVAWGELDYLLVDMPPGTGDAQLSLAQLVPLTGAVVVTMPQEVSLTDVRRAIGMAQQVKCDVLGVVENMSGEIFGSGGGAATAEQFEVPLLGTVPLDAAVRAGGDEGVPAVVGHPDSEVAAAFRSIAGKLAARISSRQSSDLPVLEV